MTEKDYNTCVHQYADNVYRFILKNLQREEDARDIVQSAFEKLWIHRNEVLSDKSKSYLFTVAYRLMIDFIRKYQKIKHEDTFEQGSQSVYQPDRQLKDVLQQALSRLTEVQRSLVMLKDYEGYNYEEIGQITQLSASQVKVYLHRARLSMREYLVGIHYII